MAIAMRQPRREFASALLKRKETTPETISKAFSFAITWGNLKVSKFIFAEFPKLCDVQKGFEDACGLQRIKMMEWLLSLDSVDCNIAQKNGSKQTVMHIAIMNDLEDTFDFLLNHEKCNLLQKRAADGRNYLMTACFKSNFKFVEKLYNSGKFKDVINAQIPKNGLTALFYSLFKKNSPDTFKIVQLLLKDPTIDVNQPNKVCSFELLIQFCVFVCVFV